MPWRNLRHTNSMSMWFYDSECFVQDWLFCFVNPHTREEVVIWNDADRLRKFHKAHENEIFVGYNSTHYDAPLMKAIICGFDAWEMNQHIIVKDEPWWKFSSLLNKVKLINYDTMSIFHSLKQLEGFQGHNIHETSVDFNIQRKLTEKERQETVKYCLNDVYECINVFLEKIDDFNAHLGMIKEFNLPIEYLSLTKAQMIAEILGAKRVKRNDQWNLRLPETLQLGKYQWIADWYMNPENHDYSKKLTANVAGCECVFAWGGLHGSRTKYHDKGEFLMIDAASLYPTLMIQYNLHSRSIVDPQKYVEIYETNLRMKAEKNPARPVYKLICNTTYGCMGNPQSKMYDKLHANLVCIFGQMLLLDLTEKLEPVCDIWNLNTDGVGVKLRRPEDRAEVERIVKDFEKRSRLTFEFDEFCEVHVKDVNNYVIVTKDGKLKSKGAYVKPWQKKSGEELLLDYDMPILREALTNAMVYGVPVERTIVECNDLRKFQKIVKVSSKYKWVEHEYGGGRIRYDNKCYRVFASNDKRDGRILKCDGVRNPAKFGGTSDNCFIFNDDLTGVSVPEKLDRQWYIDLAKKRLEDFGVSA